MQSLSACRGNEESLGGRGAGCRRWAARAGGEERELGSTGCGQRRPGLGRGEPWRLRRAQVVEVELAAGSAGFGSELPAYFLRASWSGRRAGERGSGAVGVRSPVGGARRGKPACAVEPGAELQAWESGRQRRTQDGV